MTKQNDFCAEVEFEREDMHAFQNEDLDLCRKNPFFFLLVDMGLGKTVTLATMIVDMILEFTNDDKFLIVGPIPVITFSWPDEFRRWRHLAPFSNSLVVLREDDSDPRIRAAGKKARLLGHNESKAMTAARQSIREELACSRKPVHLIDFGGLEWLTEFWQHEWPYRTVIIDESSFLKSHKSSRFKAIARVRKYDHLIHRMYLATATPASEGYEAFFTQIYLLDGGKRFTEFVTKFQKRYFVMNQYTQKWELRPGAKEEILGLIADIATVRKRSDYFNVKVPMVIERRVLLSQQEIQLYEDLQDEAVVRLPNGSVVEAKSAAALSQKLSQMASGVLYETVLQEPEDYDPDLDDGEAPDLLVVKKVHHIHDHKIEMLRQLIEEFPTESIIVGYQHKSTIDRLVKAFPKGVRWHKSGRDKEPWNAGKIPLMFMHPKSGGHGNNLQKGGRIIVFFDIPWSREQYTQLIGRLDRQGQQKAVLVFLLVAAATIDHRIAKAQRLKEGAEEEIAVILKDLIKLVRKKRSVAG